jgi:hypothetical protein
MTPLPELNYGSDIYQANPEAMEVDNNPVQGGIMFIEEEPEADAVLHPYSLYILRHPNATRDLSIQPGHAIAPIPLFWPFKTKADYLQAKLFLKTNATDSDMTEQLQLNQMIQSGQDKMGTLKDAKDFHDTLGRAVIFPEDKVCMFICRIMQVGLTS